MTASSDLTVRQQRIVDALRPFLGAEAPVLYHVLGQEEKSGESDTPTHRLVAQAMLHCGRPVLVVPYAGDFEATGKHVLVAWDGSRESAVAMRAALPLLVTATRVTLVSLRKGVQPQDPDRLLVAEMVRWLQRHGVPAVVEQGVTEIAISDALLSRASDLSVDLIVMGGYGHSRLRELMLGGVTRQVLAQMTVPTLIAH
ncbi:MAG: universal stress protein [Variovorax sp.]